MVKKDKIKYITVSLPLNLIDDINEIINMEENKGRYTGYTEFIRETIRVRIHEIKANKKVTDEKQKNLNTS